MFGKQRAREVQQDRAEDATATRARASEPGGGREAETPTQIPKPGWRDILQRVKSEVKEDRVPLIAAAVAFYFMLAIFPALIAMVSMYGLFADPVDLQNHLTGALAALPAAAKDILAGQLTEVVTGADDALSAGAVLSILAVLWSASAGIRTLMEAMNIAYDEDEKRGFVKVRLTSLALTVGAVVFVVVAVASLTIIPAALHIGDAAPFERVLQVARWPILLVVATLALNVLYRYGPSRDRPKWKWVTPGALLATFLWIGASALFSWYASHMGKFNETYGALGGVIVLLTWFYLTAIAIMLGAELNAEMEHQTARDTTKGVAKPMGARGAYVADTLGRSPA